MSPELLEIIHYLIRKGMHVAAYGILGALDFRAVRRGRSGWNATWGWIAFALAGAVAAADELHQSFVPSRSGKFGDFALDVASAGAVQLIWMLFSRR